MMKRTMAISANTSSWLNIRWGSTARYRVLSLAMKVSTAAAPTTYASAVPAARNRIEKMMTSQLNRFLLICNS
jgi:hypothetical protein